MKNIRFEKKNWVKTTIGDVVEKFADGGTPSRRRPEYFNGNIPWVVVQDIQKNISQTREQISDLGLSKSSAKLWPKGSVILSFGATIGEVGIAQVPLATKQGIAGLLPNKRITSDYLYYTLKALNSKMHRYSSGSTIKEVRPSVVSKFELLLPPLSEQKKITNILNSVDDDILATQKVIDQTEKVKKGLMQDLFTKGIGHTKFKDSELGRIPIDWDTVTLKDVCSVGSGGTPKKSVTEFWGGDIPWVSPKDMKSNRINNSIDKITEVGLRTINTAEPNDLLMVVRSGILIHSLPIGIVETKLGFNQDIKRLRVHREINAKFLYYYLKSIESLILTNGVKRGNTVHSVVTSYLENLVIPSPSQKEQERISEILRIIDEKISTYRKKKVQLMRLNRGLVQDLLISNI